MAGWPQQVRHRRRTYRGIVEKPPVDGKLVCQFDGGGGTGYAAHAVVVGIITHVPVLFDSSSASAKLDSAAAEPVPVADRLGSQPVDADLMQAPRA